MARLNGQYERHCSYCDIWYDTPSDNSLIVCPICGRKQRNAKCNRCGYEWKLHRTRYPDRCPSCKNPYYNIARVQDRDNKAKPYSDKSEESA